MGLPGLAGALVLICPLRPNEKGRAKGFFFFSFEEGESGSPASFHMASILIAKDSHSPAVQGAT